jgi:hypothetical protein
LQLAHDDSGLFWLRAAVQGPVLEETGEYDVVVHLHMQTHVTVTIFNFVNINKIKIQKY